MAGLSPTARMASPKSVRRYHTSTSPSTTIIAPKISPYVRSAFQPAVAGTRPCSVVATDGWSSMERFDRPITRKFTEYNPVMTRMPVSNSVTPKRVCSTPVR